MKKRRETWDEYFMGLAKKASERSKDRTTPTGAVIVGPDKELRSTAYNGFPRRVNDDVEERHIRPKKYLFTEHAERNAIYNAALVGFSTRGCIIFIAARPPCADCARAIIQAGIVEVVVERMEPSQRPKEQFSGANWVESTEAAMEMLNEAGVIVRRVNEKPRRKSKSKAAVASRVEIERIKNEMMEAFRDALHRLEKAKRCRK